MDVIVLRRDMTFDEQMTLNNAIYVIKYVFDLNNETTILPDNCVLKFIGGKLQNGNIGLNNAKIEACGEIFGESLKNCTNIRKVVWDVKKFSNMEPLYSGEPDYTNENDTPFTCLENLDTFVLGDNVTYVPGYICAQVQSLKNLIIGKSVTEFGDWAFEGCSGLREITNFNSTPQKGAKYGFSGVDKSACILLVPDESIELYKSTEVWRDFFISGINSGCLIGDVDNSGLIDVSDVVELADFVMGGLPEQFYKIVADVNEDGIIDVTDVVLTANRAMGD